MSQPLSDPLQAGLRFLPRPLPAAPSAHLTAGLPSREDDGLTTLHRRNPRGLGPALTPVALHLRRMSLQPPDLATYLFGPSPSAPLACLCLRRLRRFTSVGPPTRPWSPTAAVLAVAISARAPIATLAGEDTLSRGLRTPPLPATRASVGDCWQNGKCRHLLLEEQHTSRDTLVSRAKRQRTDGRHRPSVPLCAICAGRRDVRPMPTTRFCPVRLTEGLGRCLSGAPARSVALRIASPAAGGAVTGRGAHQLTAADTALGEPASPGRRGPAG
jgi:hypothetical protein